MGILILVSRTHLKDHAAYGQGPEIHGKPKRVALLLQVGKAGCCKVWISSSLKWDADIPLGRQLSRPEIGQLCAVFWHQHPS